MSPDLSTTPRPDSSVPASGQTATPRTHVPGHFWPKLVYLGFGLAVSAFAAALLGDPVLALLRGKSVETRVSEIRIVAPGAPERVYKFRRQYPPEADLAVRFQHYVTLPVDGRPTLHRISVDSRRAPVYNVNDVLRVSYRPDDVRRVAFVPGEARTWGGGALYGVVAVIMLLTAVPMLLATGRPITLDPEAPAEADGEPKVAPEKNA